MTEGEANVLVVGSINMDLVVRVGRMPAPGETTLGDNFCSNPGGKGANQALAARRLGADVRLIACVGDDASANEALELLREDGVDLSECRHVAGATTGTALIAVAPSGENHIVVAPGANREVTPEAAQAIEADVEEAELSVIETTHSELSAIVLEGWKLPDEICDAARYHHSPLDFPGADDLGNMFQFYRDFNDYFVGARDLDLWHPSPVDAEVAIERALACEAAGRAEPRISNSEGAAFNAGLGLSVYGNSDGFIGRSSGTSYSQSCVLLAGRGDGMQRDYSYDSRRCLADLEPVEATGAEAARRTVARLGARP